MSSTLMKTDCDYMDINNDKKMPALNWRLGASGAVPRPKVCAILGVSCPSERQWKPRLRQAAGTLPAIWGRPATIWMNNKKQ